MRTINALNDDHCLQSESFFLNGIENKFTAQTGASVTNANLTRVRIAECAKIHWLGIHMVHYTYVVRMEWMTYRWMAKNKSFTVWISMVRCNDHRHMHSRIHKYIICFYFAPDKIQKLRYTWIEMVNLKEWLTRRYENGLFSNMT